MSFEINIVLELVSLVVLPNETCYLQINTGSPHLTMVTTVIGTGNNFTKQHDNWQLRLPSLGPRAVTWLSLITPAVPHWPCLSEARNEGHKLQSCVQGVI